MLCLLSSFQIKEFRLTQVELQLVAQKRAEVVAARVVELGYELFDVRVERETVLPGVGNAVKQPVGLVEAAVLQTQLPLRVLCDQIEGDEGRGGVVRAVQKYGLLR